MSFLDRVTKAVGDGMDRGKKEVNQFVRIQNVNSQIGDIERKITQLKGQKLGVRVYPRTVIALPRSEP